MRVAAEGIGDSRDVEVAAVPMNSLGFGYLEIMRPVGTRQENAWSMSGVGGQAT
jgi:hypothetical protein